VGSGGRGVVLSIPLHSIVLSCSEVSDFENPCVKLTRDFKLKLTTVCDPVTSRTRLMNVFVRSHQIVVQFRQRNAMATRPGMCSVYLLSSAFKDLLAVTEFLRFKYVLYGMAQRLHSTVSPH
jgi:hypothetical protein